MLKLIGTVFIASLLAYSASYAETCAKKLSGRKPHFVTIDYRLEIRQDERHYLGSGVFTDVVLYFNKFKNKWKALKKYRPQWIDGKELDPKVFLESDFLAMNLLSQMNAHHSFKVVNYEKIPEDPTAVDVDYVVGTPLNQVILNQGVEKNVKDILLASWSKSIDALAAEMRARNFSSVKIVNAEYEGGNVFRTLQARTTSINGTTIDIWIKPDNDLIDPFTLEHQLIDAH
jgi:hypothetical protein